MIKTRSEIDLTAKQYNTCLCLLKQDIDTFVAVIMLQASMGVPLQHYTDVAHTLRTIQEALDKIAEACS